MIRLMVPDIDDADVAAVEKVLRSGFLVQGENVARFENAVAAYVGARHAVAVSNCTAALYLSLIATAVGPGDIVAVSAYSWPATANVIELVGARPLFVDVEPDTFNISIEALRRVLRSNDVAAILAVHAFGAPADCDALAEVALSNDIPLIEDAACALGSTLSGRHVGTWGLTGCFSFHPRKTITTGEGGVIVTDDAEVAATCRALRNHGQDPDARMPDFILPGLNFRLTEFQGALGEVQVAKIERHIVERRRRAAIYDRLLQGSDVQIPKRVDGSRENFQSYVILLPPAAAASRSDIIAELHEDDIETTIGTYNIPATTFFRRKYGYELGAFPVTESIASQSLTLPLHHRMAAEEQEKVVQSLAKALVTTLERS